MNSGKILLVAISFLSLPLSLKAEESAERKCEKTIYVLPQSHVNLRPGNQFQLSDQERAKIDLFGSAQFRIGRYIEASSKDTPVFLEGIIGKTLNINDRSSRMSTDDRRAEFYLRKAFAPGKSYQELSEKEKEMVISITGPIAEMILGQRNQIYATAPSQEEYEANQKKLLAILAAGGSIRMDDDPKVEVYFRKREKWALNEIIKYFKSHEKVNSAILVFGSIHNFPNYQQFMPGVCIQVPEEFKGDTAFPRYSINDEGLLQLH